jgi:hypothetical protein
MRLVRILACVFALAAAPAAAQTSAAFGDSAKAMLGNWEFSNADRDKICTATFKADKTAVGFKVEFDANCANLFPLVSGVAGWTFPDNDLLRLLDTQGRALAEFSEVEDGIYEAPTPGVGVLFIQNAAAAAPAAKTPQQIAGSFNLMQGDKPLCSLTLAPTTMKDAFALTVKPGCDPNIARQAFAQWRLDRDELVLLPARGNPWRFEEIENGTWRRLPESVDALTLVRQ